MDTTTHPDPTELDDPRIALTAIVGTLRPLVEGVGNSDLGRPTPCTEFDVEALIDHIVFVVDKFASLGRGEPWGTPEQPSLGDRRMEAFDAAADELRTVWSDSALLGQMFEVPWATMPGGALVAAYASELAVHGWDLATALGTTFDVDDDVLEGPLCAAMQIPTEDREHPDMPFDPVVEVDAGATRLERMVALSGRRVG